MNRSLRLQSQHPRILNLEGGTEGMKSKYFLALLVRCLSLIFGMLAFLALFGMEALPASAESMTLVRIIHASPDIGTADIFVDGTKLLSNFQFGTVTDYVSLPTGPHKVQVALIGKGPGAATITQELSLSAGMVYTVAALGTKSTGFSLKVFTDNDQISGGNAKVRFYHLAPDAGAVNVVTHGKTIISGLSYEQASDYFSLPAGPSTFQVTTIQANVSVSVTLKEHSVASIFGVGLFNGTPQMRLVVAQTDGVPGWPGTGSDPNLQPDGSQQLVPWLLAALLMVSVGGGVVTFGLTVVQKGRIRVRDHRRIGGRFV